MWIPRLVKALLALSLRLVGAIALVGIVILKRQGDIPPMKPQCGGLIALCVFAAILVAIWWVPSVQAHAASGDETTAADRAMLADRFRRTLAGIVGGIVLLVMLAAALRTAAAVAVISRRAPDGGAVALRPDFCGADLRGIHLDSADLSLAHMDGARLTDGAVLARAILRGIDLDDANLQGADSRAARLDSADMAGTHLKGALLDSASLRWADLQGPR